MYAYSVAALSQISIAFGKNTINLKKDV